MASICCPWVPSQQAENSFKSLSSLPKSWNCQEKIRDSHVELMSSKAAHANLANAMTKLNFLVLASKLWRWMNLVPIQKVCRCRLQACPATRRPVSFLLRKMRKRLITRVLLLPLNTKAFRLSRWDDEGHLNCVPGNRRSWRGRGTLAGWEIMIPKSYTYSRMSSLLENRKKIVYFSKYVCSMYSPQSHKHDKSTKTRKTALLSRANGAGEARQCSKCGNIHGRSTISIADDKSCGNVGHLSFSKNLADQKDDRHLGEFVHDI